MICGGSVKSLRAFSFFFSLQKKGFLCKFGFFVVGWIQKFAAHMHTISFVFSLKFRQWTVWRRVNHLNIYHMNDGAHYFVFKYLIFSYYLFESDVY